ncbi:hypothetical protein O6H91_Y259000 [Diphasiastrum complanatum]|nr:hypothetical protein O6H91_Y259000 [Diphasiastrum complanatum]
MSWQSYVDEHLMMDLGRGQHLSAAAILGQDGSVWAQSASFPAVLFFISDFLHYWNCEHSQMNLQNC